MNIVQSAIDYAVNIANDDSHGYDQIHRNGPNYDCSSLVIEAYEQAGAKVKENGATFTGNMRSAFLASGFVDVTASVDLATGAGLQPGDVLLNDKKHTELYIGDGQTVAASINEKGTISGGKSGDQTGREILVRPYHNHPWNVVLRYQEHPPQEEPQNGPITYTVQAGDTLTKIANRFGVTVQQLVVWNKLKNPDLIIVGQQLIVENAPEIWTGIVATQTDPLNIRKTPNGKIIGSIPKGERIRIQGGVSGWLKLADRDGYVSSKYVQRC